MTAKDAPNHDRPRVRPVPTPKVVLCPFCGGLSPNLDLCTRCKGRFDPLSRQASQNAMGPWSIRDDKNPFAPGCSFETIRMLIARGRIQPNTILRGPTTNQFWTLAKRAPSIANLLSLCHNCQSRVDPKDFSCASCGAAFTREPDRQHLGLAPLQHLPGQAPPAVIAALSGPPIGFDPVEVTRYGRSPGLPSPGASEFADDRPSQSGLPEPARRRRVVSNKGDDTRTWLMLGGAMMVVIVLGAVFGPALSRRLADDSPSPRATSPVQGETKPASPTPPDAGISPAEREQAAAGGDADGTAPTPTEGGTSGVPVPPSGDSAVNKRLGDLLREDSRESLETALELLRMEGAETPGSAGLRASIERRLSRESVRRLP